MEVDLSGLVILLLLLLLLNLLLFLLLLLLHLVVVDLVVRDTSVMIDDGLRGDIFIDELICGFIWHDDWYINDIFGIGCVLLLLLLDSYLYRWYWSTLENVQWLNCCNWVGARIHTTPCSSYFLKLFSLCCMLYFFTWFKKSFYSSLYLILMLLYILVNCHLLLYTFIELILCWFQLIIDWHLFLSLSLAVAIEFEWTKLQQWTAQEKEGDFGVCWVLIIIRVYPCDNLVDLPLSNKEGGYKLGQKGTYVLGCTIYMECVLERLVRWVWW